MGVARLLAGAFLCASCGFHRIDAADAPPQPATYTAPSGTTRGVRIITEAQPSSSAANIIVSSGFSSGASMAFPGAPGSSNGFRIARGVELRVGEAPQATTRGENTAMSFHPTTIGTGATPRPKTQVLYGWVPEPRLDVSLAQQNLEELKSALQSRAFVLRLRCTYTRQCRFLTKCFS